MELICGNMEQTNRLSDYQLWLAETICDCLKDDAHWPERSVRAGIKRLRRDICCSESPIQEYKCHVQIRFSKQSGIDPICCDTCLQDEIHELIYKHGIWTIGSCCGHGIKQPYIQVSPKYVQKMHELNYEQLPVDENGNGQWCFLPKTDL